MVLEIIPETCLKTRLIREAKGYFGTIKQLSHLRGFKDAIELCEIYFRANTQQPSNNNNGLNFSL